MLCELSRDGVRRLGPMHRILICVDRGCGTGMEDEEFSRRDWSVETD